MCGQYTHYASWQEIRCHFDLLGPARNIEARYNIAPSQDAPLMRRFPDGERELVMLRWGLVRRQSGQTEVRLPMTRIQNGEKARKPSRSFGTDPDASFSIARPQYFRTCTDGFRPT